MLTYTIYVTRRSTNAIKEFSKYCWKLDKNGKPLNEPVDAFNHTIDPARYVSTMFLSKFNKKRRARVYSTDVADASLTPIA